MKVFKYCPLLLCIVCIFASVSVFSATTGKIAGKITDKESGHPLTGANVIVEGTTLGAATDLDGEYFIINIPPGFYNLRISMMGYAPVISEGVRVSVNATSTINAAMSMEVIEGQSVTVTADAISFKKDQTSAVRHVSSNEISVLPVQNMDDLVEMQSGVVNGHFRGGRRDEVSYLVDGLPVEDAFGNMGNNSKSKLVTLENDVIEDIEVITGTFNAEYGRAMSGIVNAITKDGSNDFHGSFSGMLGNYYTGEDLYIGLKNSDIARNQDYKVQFETPIVKNKLFVFANARYQNNKNHLNAVRRFLVTDYSDYSTREPESWLDIHNGDMDYVPLSDSENRSVFGKMTWKPLPATKLSLTYSLNDDSWQVYNHNYKYAPDGKSTEHRKTHMLSFQLNQNLSKTMFHELKASWIDNTYGNYLYENPLDSRYIHDQYRATSGPGFLTGGQDKNHTVRVMKDLNLKYDLTWQLHKNHSVKLGGLYIGHNLDNQSYQIRNKYYADPAVYDNYYDPELQTIIYPKYAPEVYGDSTLYGEEYQVKPNELSLYIQDKMEFNEMVINLGIRYDQFDPNTTYPSNWRNPANQLNYPNNPDQMSQPLDAEVKRQISPRFGISYQLSDAALLHFSYGHFFQAPPMYAFYRNHSFLVATNNYVTESGNPQLKAQQTVQYEIGFWQELMTGMGLEINLFYRDIYDLLSMRIMTTYNQVRYGLYTNKDYGNVKGLELNYDYAWQKISARVNYTLQYTRGNADDPLQTFNRAGSNQDPISRLIPMSWDQRHTVSMSVSYAMRNAVTTLSGYYNSGTPYTWSPIAESRLSRVNLYPNNAWQPNTLRFDIYSYYDYRLNDSMHLRFSLYVENLLDRRNELFVNGNTGRANEAIIREVDLASHKSLFNDYEDRIMNPASYSAPRYIKFGVGFMF